MITTTPAKLAQICPKIPQSRINGILTAMDFFAINTPLREAAFIAQCAHESRDFSVTEENLHYSAERLIQVFPKYFRSLEQATFYAQNPRAIANLVYANRMGNGNETSGDGFRFRGRGYLQLTGHDNYMKFSAASALDAMNNPDLVADPDGAALSAGWFWAKNGINTLADKGDFEGVTRKINGGIVGLEARLKYYDKAKAVLHVG